MIYTIVKKVGEKIDSVMSFDSVSSFDESWTASVTTQTVEKGFNISDNINIEPPTYDIQAIISSYSLFGSEKEIVWNGQDFSSQAVNENSSIIARDKLIDLFKSRSILTLVESSFNSNSTSPEFKYQDLQRGHFKEIENCVITSLSISNPDSATGAFIVSMKLQKIYVALVTVTEVPEGGMTRTLIPLNKSAVKSATNATTGEVTDDTTDIAQQAGDDINIEEDNTDVGMTQRQGEIRKAAKLEPYLTENEAKRETLRRAKATGRGYTYTKQGSGFIVHPI